MRLTPAALRARENAILDALEHAPGDRTFRGKLYRDGVPSPVSYLRQRVRVLFVLREPNLRGPAYAVDMRDEVRDKLFRPLLHGTRRCRPVRCWWNFKAGLFAHAVGSALDGQPAARSFERFEALIHRGGWNHDVVNRFAYIQIKKVGGGGSSTPREIRHHAERYARTLKAQVALYRPHLILGCGVGSDSPAQLLSKHVIPGGDEERTVGSGATWWRFDAEARPLGMVQLWHPSRRRSRSELYEDVWSSVREVARAVGIRRVK